MSLQIKKIKFSFPAFEPSKGLKAFQANAQDMVAHEGFSTRLISQRSMKKRPKRAKSRYGERRFYGQNTKAYARGRRSYFRRGRYSRPGFPPHYDSTLSFNIRKPQLVKIQRGKGANIAVSVGPKAQGNQSVPMIHEQGGVQRIRTRDRMVVAKYPPRPYMRPAAKLARQSVRNRGKKPTLKRMKKLGPYRAKRVWYSGDQTPVRQK